LSFASTSGSLETDDLAILSLLPPWHPASPLRAPLVLEPCGPIDFPSSALLVAGGEPLPEVQFDGQHRLTRHGERSARRRKPMRDGAMAVSKDSITRDSEAAVEGSFCSGNKSRRESAFAFRAAQAAQAALADWGERLLERCLVLIESAGESRSRVAVEVSPQSRLRIAHLGKDPLLCCRKAHKKEHLEGSKRLLLRLPAAANTLSTGEGAFTGRAALVPGVSAHRSGQKRPPARYRLPPRCVQSSRTAFVPGSSQGMPLLRALTTSKQYLMCSVPLRNSWMNQISLTRW
jgi:hypothetical protein